MRTLAVLTTGRQDWGILRPVCLALRDSTRWETRVLVGGMHLDPARGVASEIEAIAGTSGAIALLDGTSGEGAAQAAAMTVAIVDALQGAHALLVVGDRSETAAAALGAAIGRIPIVHLHGGEET